MTRSQLNIKLSVDLLKKIKRQAMMSGKSLTEHITDLITRSIDGQTFDKYDLEAASRIDLLVERLSMVESTLQNYGYLNDQKLTPFTDLEAVNCTNFMRGVFQKTYNEKGFNSKKVAFLDFCQHVRGYEKWNEALSLRLREVMLMDDPDPFTGKELNDLSKGNKCNCPIRFGLISWTGLTEVPSQQEICDKGDELINSL